MRLGITMDDKEGLAGNVSGHFGQCKFFLLIDIDNGKILESRIAENTAVHGGGGCLAVDELMKHDVTDVISGGMGYGAQQKFAAAGVRVFGYSGRVEDAVREFLDKKIGGLGSCKDSSACH